MSWLATSNPIKPRWLVDLTHAYRALKTEIIDFNFTYPLAIDRAAGPKDSLNYYLYSDALSWSDMRMDENGTPMTWGRTTGINYWPGFIAWYGLVQLGQYVRGKGQTHLNNFLRQVDWLEEHAVRRQHGEIVWAMDFDYRDGGVLLRAPWVSAHAQGFVISALVRGWRMTRKQRLLDILQRSADIFAIDVTQGGVRSEVNGAAFYAEIPGASVPGILDGFMIGLLGLYDLYIETGDRKVGQLLQAGIAGLRTLLPSWNYRDKWSWYADHEYLCTPCYHNINRLLLGIIADLQNDVSLKELAKRWDPANLTVLGRAEIRLGVIFTKNLARFRRKTWSHKTADASARKDDARDHAALRTAAK